MEDPDIDPGSWLLSGQAPRCCGLLGNESEAGRSSLYLALSLSLGLSNK